MLPLKIKAKVTAGKGRGKGLGIPTINFVIPQKFSLSHGVYAGKIFIEGKYLPAAIHLGPRPVFKENDISLEVYVLSHIVVIPDETEIIFHKRIRDIMSFTNPMSMVKQIKKDVKEIKKILKIKTLP